MKTFIKKWHKVCIKDDGAYTSEEYKSFAKDAKKALLKALRQICPEFDIKKYRIGHYDLSGFVSYKGKYVYFSHDIPRGCTPVDLKAVGCCDGWLYRTANDENDFTGGNNHFCETANLPIEISEMLIKEAETNL